MRNSSLIQKHSTKQKKRKKKRKCMQLTEVFKWKKGFLMKNKRHLVRGKICQKKKNTLVSLFLGFDLSIKSAIALVGMGCEELMCWNELAVFVKILCIFYTSIQFVENVAAYCILYILYLMSFFLDQNWMSCSMESHLASNNSYFNWYILISKNMLSQLPKIMPETSNVAFTHFELQP